MSMVVLVTIIGGIVLVVARANVQHGR